MEFLNRAQNPLQKKFMLENGFQSPFTRTSRSFLEIRAQLSKISFYLLVRNIEMQRQRDRQMELSNKAHVQFQEDSIEDKEKGKYSVEASREMARIQAGINISSQH